VHRIAAICFGLLAVLVLAGSVAAATAPVTSGGQGSATGSWAYKEIASVVDAELMGPDLEAFRPDDDLTRGELYDALMLLGVTPPPPAEPEHPVTMRELDTKLVNALGLGSAARRIRIAVIAAGLDPTSYVGTETVARLLGLRINHPQTQEWLERGPDQNASRAEAAYSLAHVLMRPTDRIAWINDLAESLQLPVMSDWQRAVLVRGLRLVGYPYVFAGTSERRQKLWSATGKLVDAPAGFDCSGFVWRVYKTEPFADAPQLASVLRGRTTYQMSGEVSASLRIGIDVLEPGDILFFGSRGPASKPSQVGHSGLYVGNGWFAHSSSNGVTLQPLEGWYRTSFAWARRPLAEAGLETS
jgi:NlpC/P60 family protein/S-layer family protein